MNHLYVNREGIRIILYRVEMADLYCWVRGVTRHGKVMTIYDPRLYSRLAAEREAREKEHATGTWEI